MSSTNNLLLKLKDMDLYSLALFSLYKLMGTEEN